MLPLIGIFVANLFKPRRQLEIENLFLHHQLNICMRQARHRRRWPPPETAKTIAWDKAREAVALLRALIRVVDDGCLQAEQNADLSPEGIARRREAVGRQALSESENWPPERAAERAITENIDFLERK
jgi:hypothetical protein